MLAVVVEQRVPTMLGVPEELAAVGMGEDQ
jgi:hypothetical protein